MSTFLEYEAKAARTFPQDKPADWWMIAALGLMGEAGEFADSTKKFLYHGHAFDPNAMALELGDVLWYLALAAKVIGTTLEDVARLNIEKLNRRYPDGFSHQASRERSE